MINVLVQIKSHAWGQASKLIANKISVEILDPIRDRAWRQIWNHVRIPIELQLREELGKCSK